MNGTWLRLFDKDGKLVLSENEASARRADEQHQRAVAAEAQLAKLREHLPSAEKKSNGSVTSGKAKKK